MNYLAGSISILRPPNSSPHPLGPPAVVETHTNTGELTKRNILRNQTLVFTHDLCNTGAVLY